MDWDWLGILRITVLTPEEQARQEERIRARYHHNRRRHHHADIEGDQVVIYETIDAAQTVIGRFQIAGN